MKKTSLIIVAMAMLIGSLFAAPKEKKPPVVIFDPATTTVNAGEVVTIDGEKYLKITVDGYNTTFSIPAVDLNGYKNFICKAFTQEAVGNYNFTVKICDDDNSEPSKGPGEISTPQYYGTPDAPKQIVGEKAKQEPWNKLSNTKIASQIQLYVQDSTKNYEAISDFTVYLGKVSAQ